VRQIVLAVGRQAHTDNTQPTTCGIRPESVLKPAARLDGSCSGIDDPRARPVEVSPVFKDHIHIGVTEIGKPADGFDLGRAEKRGGDR